VLVKEAADLCWSATRLAHHQHLKRQKRASSLRTLAFAGPHSQFLPRRQRPRCRVLQGGAIVTSLPSRPLAFKESQEIHCHEKK
jgi:hypothetical protein